MNAKRAPRSAIVRWCRPPRRPAKAESIAGHGSPACASELRRTPRAAAAPSYASRRRAGRRAQNLRNAHSRPSSLSVSVAVAAGTRGKRVGARCMARTSATPRPTASHRAQRASRRCRRSASGDPARRPGCSFEARSHALLCGTLCWPGPRAASCSRSPTSSATRSPDVILNLYSGGAHCCSSRRSTATTRAARPTRACSATSATRARSSRRSTGGRCSSPPTTASPTSSRRSRSQGCRSRSGASSAAASSTSRARYPTLIAADASAPVEGVSSRTASRASASASSRPGPPTRTCSASDALVATTLAALDAAGELRSSAGWKHGAAFIARAAALPRQDRVSASRHARVSTSSPTRVTPTASSRPPTLVAAAAPPASSCSRSATTTPSTASTRRSTRGRGARHPAAAGDRDLGRRRRATRTSTCSATASTTATRRCSSGCASARADRERRAERMVELLRGERLRDRRCAARASPRTPASRSGARTSPPPCSRTPTTRSASRDEGHADVSSFIAAQLIPGAPAYARRTRPTVAGGDRRGSTTPAGSPSGPTRSGTSRSDDEVLAAIERYRGVGLDGVECFYVTHDERQTLLLADRCEAARAAAQRVVGLPRARATACSAASSPTSSTAARAGARRRWRVADRHNETLTIR